MRPVAVPADPEVASGRTIGEILLARSLVAEEALDEAIAIQRETGKPLGQILVEAGTITRLELASALAEQWGDAGTISPTFPGGSAYIDPTEHDGNPSAQLEELKRTRRALEERMLAFERTATDAQWQQEIAAGVRALFSRVDVLEAAQGQLSDRHDAALSDDLRNAVVELAQRVEAVAPELETLRERVDGTASVAAVQYGLSEIAERIDDLLPQVQRAETQADAVTERVEEVTAGLAAAIDELRRMLQSASASQHELEGRLQGTVSTETVGSLHTAIEEVRGAVIELARRPSADPDLPARLDALAAEVASRADDAELGALAAVVAELSRRPSGDPQIATVIDELTTRVDELSERLELGAGVVAGDGESDPRVDSLIARVAELAARPVVDPALEARLAETAARVGALAAELAARPVVDPALESRLVETAHRVDAVAAELAGRADAAGQAELSRLVAELEERPAVDPALAEQLDGLAAQVRELAARPVADPDLAARVEELATRIELGAAQPAGEGEPDPRVDALLAKVAELTEQVEAIGKHPDGGEVPADLSDRVVAAGELSRTLAGELSQAVSAWTEGRRELEARVEWLAARVEAVVSAPPPVAAPSASGGKRGAAADDAEVERLRMAVERLMLDFAEHRRALSAAVPGRDLDNRVRTLTDQVAELNGLVLSVEGGSNGASPGGGGSIDRELAGQVRSLVGRLEEVEASSTAGRETMLARLERMMGTIDWRLQRLENPSD